MITIRKLHKRKGARTVLSDIDADVAEGEAVAIVGSSGGGKTTLLRCLNALDPFDEGSVRIAGFELEPQGRGLLGEHQTRLRTAVGMVFQELHLFSHLTVLENVTLAPRVVRREEAEKTNARARQLLSEVGLKGREGAYPHELSGGQKQRVAIVRALASNPSVLLLDEPTSALDTKTANGVADTIRALTHGRVTVVVVTHHVGIAERIADRVLTLENGILRAGA